MVRSKLLVFLALLGAPLSAQQNIVRVRVDATDVQRRLFPVEGDAVDGALRLARRAVMNV